MIPNNLKTTAIICVMFVLVALMFVSSIFAIIQDKKAVQLKQDKILANIGFDRVVLFTLIALEENYQVKERLLPRVHKDDYFIVILNTAKRRALEDNKNQIVLPSSTAISDSTKKK